MESRTRLIADFKEISNLNFDNYSNTKILNQNRIFVTNSSGRTQIWNEILNKSKNSLMFGYGSQSDRFYINRDKKE